MWSKSLCSVFNLATDVQAHMPLWYILFTHIIASCSKLLPVLQHKTPTACYSPSLHGEEQKSSLFFHQQVLTWECLRAACPTCRITALCAGLQDPRERVFPRGFWGKAPGRQQRTRLHLLGFLGRKTSESPRRKALAATHRAIQSFPRRGLNAEHHRTLRGSKIILITNKGILITNKGTEAN